LRSWLTVIFALCATLACPYQARAQSTLLPSRLLTLSPAPDRLSPDEARQLDEWLHDVGRWQKADKRWHNEPAHDPFGRIIKRTERPEPPEWLAPRCGALAPEIIAEMPGTLGTACRLLTHLDSDPTAAAIATATAAQRADNERTKKGSFFTRVHIDGLWTTTSTDVRLYGLVGSHISLVDLGRMQFFGPPGIILLSVPDGRGSREIRAGYTWGMSIRLGDIRLFSPTKNMTLFLTISKVWLTGGTYDSLEPGGFDIAGFSIAPRKPRR
jgi:hypothetical protein